MKLRMYEIEAVASEIVNKITQYNNSLGIPTEKELRSNLEKNHPKILKINQLINKIQELEEEIKKIWKDCDMRGFYYSGYENQIINKILDNEVKELRENAGFKVIDQQKIRNLVVLNSNKDLKEIINIVSSELGIKI